jgi:hypothetical protein
MKPRAKTKINRPPILFDKTQAVITRLERALGRPFLAYWNSTNGSVCNHDVVGFFEILQKMGKKRELVLFIKSDGGTGRASLRIVHLLRQYAHKITAVVPLECVSAATMMALGADEILMGPMAYLSAVDTSITHDLSPVDKDNELVSVSQNELERIGKLWGREANGSHGNPYQSLFQHVHPLVIGSVDRASSLSIRLCNEILSYHMKDRKKAERISNALNASYPAHTYPITLKEAKRIGLPVRGLDSAINDLLLELNEHYSEMGQHAQTDFDEQNYHDNEIMNIVEGRGVQVFYQTDKDWHYRVAERRWIALRDKSSWRRIERAGRGMRESIFHVR